MEYQDFTVPQTISTKIKHQAAQNWYLLKGHNAPFHYTTQPFMMSGSVCSSETKQTSWQAMMWSITSF